MLESETLELLILIIFTLSSVLLTTIDIKNKRLPNLIVLPTIIIILVIITINQSLNESYSDWISVLGIPSLVTILWLLISAIYPNGLGMGDIKVIFLIGIVLCRLEPVFFFFSLCISFITGAIFASLALTITKRNSEFAFGPFLLIPAVGIEIVNSLN